MNKIYRGFWKNKSVQTKVMNTIQDHLDRGLNRGDAYQYLSKHSLMIFGHQFSATAIQRGYSRNNRRNRIHPFPNNFTTNGLRQVMSNTPQFTYRGLNQHQLDKAVEMYQTFGKYYR